MVTYLFTFIYLRKTLKVISQFVDHLVIPSFQRRQYPAAMQTITRYKHDVQYALIYVVHFPTLLNWVAPVAGSHAVDDK